MTKYEKRVQAFEDMGLKRSDAQGAVEAEDMKATTAKQAHTPWRQGERGWILDSAGRMVTKEAVIACSADNERLRQINAELVAALECLLSATNDKRVTVGDCNQARAAIEHAKEQK